MTARCNRVLGQAEKQLLDIVVIVLLKLEPRPDDALLKRQRLSGNEIRENGVDLLLRLARELQVILEVVGVRQICVNCLRRLDEQGVELRTTPLNAVSVKSSIEIGQMSYLNGVVNGVGEVLDRAGGSLLLGGVLRRCI